MMIKNYYNTKITIVGIFVLVVLSLNLFIIYNDTDIGDEDAAAYALQGKSISAGEGLISRVVWLFIQTYQSPIHKEDYWPPLQSYLIAASIGIFGESIFTIKLPNVVIYSMLIVLVYVLGTQLFDKKVGFLASLMCLFSADLSLYAISCRNEIFHIFMLTICLFCASKSIEKNAISYKGLCITGALIGISFLQKPVALLLLCTFIFWLLCKSYFLVKNHNDGYKLKQSAIGLLLLIISFFAVSSPYLIRNIYEFKRILPPLPFNLSAIYLESYKNNPAGRNIDSDLSHYKEMRQVYYNTELKVNYASKSEIIYVTKKFLNEMLITFLMLKRSYIFQIGLIFLATFSYFFVRGKAKNYLEIFFIYFTLNVLYISTHQHTEQRYFVFIIPVIAIYASNMFFVIEKIITKSKPGGQNFLQSSKMYWAFIALFLLLTLAVPNISFYSQKINNLNRVKDYQVIGRWLKENTPSASVIMSAQPHRISYYADRPAIQLPLANKDEFFDICKRFKVSHIIIPHGMNDAGRKFLQQSEFVDQYIELKKIKSNIIFSKKNSWTASF